MRFASVGSRPCVPSSSSSHSPVAPRLRPPADLPSRAGSRGDTRGAGLRLLRTGELRRAAAPHHRAFAPLPSRCEFRASPPRPLPLFGPAAVPIALPGISGPNAPGSTASPEVAGGSTSGRMRMFATARMREIRNIVILTGAGISAESGLATFRGPDGLWEGHRVEDVATPEAFARDPVLVHALLRRAPRQSGDGRAQCGAPGAGAARRRMAGRIADRHPECRRPARARRGEAAAAHARRAQLRLVPRLRRADGLDRRDGPRPGLSRTAAPRAGSGPTSSGSARCPTRWSGSTGR